MIGVIGNVSASVEHVLLVRMVTMDRPDTIINGYIIGNMMLRMLLQRMESPPVSLWGLHGKNDRIKEGAMSRKDERRLTRRPRENGEYQMIL